MKNCFNCNSLLPERGFFCTDCGIQTKCKTCSDFLEPNSNFCAMCGTVIGEDSKTDGDATKQNIAPSQSFNTFEFRETRTERSAKAVFTDTVADKLNDALSLVVSSYPLGTIVKKRRSHPANLSGDLFPEMQDEINVTPTKEIPSAGNETAEKLSRLFYKDAEKLVLEVQDLKASGAKDFGIRLIYLRLLYSKEIQKEEFTLREDINDTLKEVMGYLDPNIVNWVSKNNDLALKEDGDKAFVRLKADGHTKALEVLEEVTSSDKSGSFIPEKRSRNTSKSSSKTDETNAVAKPSSKTSAKKGRQKSTDVQSWIDKWNQLNLNIDLHGIAKDASVLERIVLGIWVVQKATAGSTDSANTYKLAELINKLFFVPTTRQNLDRVLKGDTKSCLMRTSAGWRITPTGIERANTLTNTKAKAKE